MPIIFFFVSVGVFTQTAFTLASPHLHAVLAARLAETLFSRRREWLLSRSLAQAEPESPAWRRVFSRPTSGDESAGFLPLIGVFGEELAAVSKPASLAVDRRGGPFAPAPQCYPADDATTAGWMKRSHSNQHICVRYVYLTLWWIGSCPSACPGPNLLWDEEVGWTDPGFHGFN